MKGCRVLVVDDDRKTVELIKLYLLREGCTVLTAYDGKEALEKTRNHAVDLIILDVMLPELDGVSVCRTVREESSVAVIMLTARTTEQDKLIGLHEGADDYVIKPFSPRELIARVRAVMRRLPNALLERGPETVSAGGITVNFRTQEIQCDGKPIQLTPIEFRLLGTLLRSPGRVFSRGQLVEAVYGIDFEGSDRTIDVHIRNVRKKIQNEKNTPPLIQTVFGVGYKCSPAGVS